MPAGGRDLRLTPCPVPRLFGVEKRVGHGAQHHGREDLGSLRPGRGDDQGHPVVELRSEPDMEVGTERFGDLVAEEGSEALAGDPPHQFAHQIALGDGVVAGAVARLPPRLLGGEQRRHLVPVVQVLGRHRFLPARQAGRVGHHVADEHAVLAVRGELRPVAGDGCVEVELAPIGEHQCRYEGHGLGGGPHVDDRVPLPRHRLVPVGESAPQIDDRLAVEIDRNRRPHVDALGEVGGERLTHRREPVVAQTAEICHDADPTPWPLAATSGPQADS